ncbi:hypothetical protein C5167_017440 [Papaver somniferum]|uniref:Uncharacterized protein n=1 Tax=Papaver somniferum TaxID=3469 RepID=A0A4Y7IJF7_PAPSO|nr:hypothetical protein C5167_017440 [Papaver somniferum]
MVKRFILWNIDSRRYRLPPPPIYSFVSISYETRVCFTSTCINRSYLFPPNNKFWSGAYNTQKRLLAFPSVSFPLSDASHKTTTLPGSTILAGFVQIDLLNLKEKDWVLVWEKYCGYEDLVVEGEIEHRLLQNEAVLKVLSAEPPSGSAIAGGTGKDENSSNST